MKARFLKFLPRKFLPWGSIWCAAVLLLLSCLTAVVGAFSVAREEARFPEPSLGDGILVMMFALPVSGLLCLSLLLWILGLVNIAYGRFVSWKAKQLHAD